MNTDVITQLAERASSLRLDLDAPFDDLDPLTHRVQDATIVALGSAIRHSHELSTLTHRVMRFLIEQHGFRSIALEGDEEGSISLDTYVCTGEGDPMALLSGLGLFGDLQKSSKLFVGYARATNGIPEIKFASYT